MTIDRLIEQGAEAGLKPEEVFDMTLRDLSSYLIGRARAEREKWKLAMWAAWNTAAMSRARKMPALDRLMSKLDDKPKRQTKKQIWGTIAMIHAMHKGTNG